MFKFCLSSDTVMEWSCFCLDLSWSQNDLVWVWHSVKLFIFHRKTPGPHCDCQANPDVRGCRFFLTCEHQLTFDPLLQYKTHWLVFCSSTDSSAAHISDRKRDECQWLFHNSLSFCFIMYGPNITIPYLPKFCPQFKWAPEINQGLWILTLNSLEREYDLPVYVRWRTMPV